MAACYLKLEEHQKCVDACAKALELGSSAKAHFRRGQAYLELRAKLQKQTELISQFDAMGHGKGPGLHHLETPHAGGADAPTYGGEDAPAADDFAGAIFAVFQKFKGKGKGKGKGADTGKAAAWLQDLLDTPAFESASGSAIDPPAIANNILRIRGELAAAWAEAIVDDVKGEHAVLRREILERSLVAE